MKRQALGPHRDGALTSIANVAGIGMGRISVKATTSERLGFVGRGEGIAVQAIATIELPPENSDGDLR